MIPRYVSPRFVFARLGVFIGLVLLVATLYPSTTCAQPILAQSSLKQRFEAGQAAFRADHYEEAIQHLRAVATENLAFHLPKQGAATYWLGRALAARGDSLKAHAVWRMGMYALETEGIRDARLMDAYVRSTFRQEISNEYVPAARTYTRLLKQADSGSRPRKRSILRRYVAQMLFLLPDSLRATITDDAEAVYEGEGTITKTAGPRLSAWWQRQDPHPATPANERVIEHLHRVAQAERHFADESLRGFDDRGMIYVRLGTPAERRELSSASLAQSGSSHAAFIPRNEYWRYHGLGRYSHYVFVRRGGRYELGSVTDLLPTPLRHNLSGTGPLAALALYDFYDTFVPRVPEYYPLFDQVENTVAKLKQVANLQFTTATRLADSGFDPTGGGERYPGVDRSFLREAERVEREVAQTRARTMPTVRTATAYSNSRLPVAVRTARFLRNDGSTRTEVYWSVPSDALRADAAAMKRLAPSQRPFSDEHVLRLTTIRYGPAYQEQKKNRSRQMLRATRDSTAHTFALTLPGGSTRYHLALQWDQYLVPKGAPPADSTQWTAARTGTYWADSLQALPADPNRLVLSDLVPLWADSLNSTAPEANGRFSSAPYPFRTVVPDMKLAFYLEAYHLTFGPDDQTRYTVEYEVHQRRKRGGLRSLFGGDEAKTTATSTTYEGDRRTAREYVALDLSPWAEAENLTITVRVTDEVSGQQAERSVAFDVKK